MGNNSGISEFERHNWRKVQELENKVILFNDITQKSVQRHQAILDSDEGQVISLCQWRESLENSGVVDLYEYGMKNAGMCNGLAQLYVITERIHLFEQIGKISKTQGFLVLRNIVSGLQVLFKKFGYFNPQSNIMGINNEGQAKIWINQNFAMSTPEKDPIPVQKSEKTIINNLIRIIQSKTYPQERFQFNYPQNFDFQSTIEYVDRLKQKFQGLIIDRVYIDRTQYARKYTEILQRQLQKQQLSRTIAQEAQLRLRQIQLLHQNLRHQQLQLQQRQQQLLFQALQTKQQQQFQRQQQIQQLQYLQQIQLSRQKQQRQKQILYSQQAQLVQHHLNSDNSRGQILIGTTSTNNTQIYANPTKAQVQPPKTGYINHYSQVNGGFINPSSQVNAKYINSLSQVNGGYINPQSHVNGISTQRSQPKLVYRPETMSPENNKFKKSFVTFNNRPPLPSQGTQTQENMSKPTIQIQAKKSSSRQGRQVSTDKIKKQIQLVDSMILMQEDQNMNQNKRYVQSRIIKYAI